MWYCAHNTFLRYILCKTHTLQNDRSSCIPKNNWLKSIVFSARLLARKPHFPPYCVSCGPRMIRSKMTRNEICFFQGWWPIWPSWCPTVLTRPLKTNLFLRQVVPNQHSFKTRSQANRWRTLEPIHRELFPYQRMIDARQTWPHRPS